MLKNLPAAKLVKNSSIYTVVAFLQKAIGFLLLPIYTVFLTPVDYGKVNVVNTLMGIVSVLFNLSLQGAAIRFHYKHADERIMRKKIWGTTFCFVFLNTAALSVLLLLFHRAFLDPFAENVMFSPFILLGLITTGLSPTFMFYQTMLQAEQNGKRYGLNNLVFFIVNLGLTIAFVVGYKMGAVGILLANAISNGLFFVYSAFVLLPKIKLGIDKIILKEALKYALPLIPYNLAAYTALMIDRLFLNKMKGTGDVGIYSVGFQFANIVTIVTGAIAQAYSPWFFEKWEKGEEGRAAIAKILPIISLVFAILGLGMALLGPLALSIMVSKSFTLAWQVIPCMSMGYAFSGIYLLGVNGLFISKTYLLPLLAFAGLIVNVALNLLVIPRYGILGASFSSMVYNIFMTLLVILLAEKIEQIGYNKTRLFNPFLVAIPAAMAAFPLYKQPLPLRVGGLFLVFIIALCVLALLNRRSLRNYSIKWRENGR